MTKIAHVFATFGAGGPQIRAAQLMRHLGSDHRHVVMAMDGCTDARSQIPDDLTVSYVEPPAQRGFLAMMRTQRRWLAEVAPDVVLTYNWGAIESATAARRLGLPLVHHEDGFGPEEVERRLRRRNWIRRLALKSVPVIVPSAVLQRIAQQEWGMQSEQVHLLVNGVDLLRFVPPVERDAADVTFGTVGGLRAEKDHETLLRAVSQTPGSARLRLVGGGPLEARLRSLAGELGLTERVDFIGPVGDTAPEYRQIDVFVLSSRTEQMPIALLEAMASGCAVAATDVGDVGAVLPDEQRPFVVAPGDSKALAAAMAGLAGDAALRRQLARRNRERAEQRFELRQCLDRFAAVYAAATSRRRT